MLEVYCKWAIQRLVVIHTFKYIWQENRPDRVFLAAGSFVLILNENFSKNLSASKTKEAYAVFDKLRALNRSFRGLC